MEREALRAQATDLIQRLRGEPGIPQALFELLDNFERRLTRIELGEFDAQDEVPTKPDRRISSSQMPATRLPERLDKIFEGVFPKKEG
jgi:hypothetical protein